MNWPHETDFNALCAFYGNPIIGARENGDVDCMHIQGAEHEFRE